MADTDREHGIVPETDRPLDGELSGAPSLDLDRYMPMVAELNISEDQKREFLFTVWNILVTIVDLGLRLDPIPALFRYERNFDLDQTPKMVDLAQAEADDLTNDT